MKCNKCNRYVTEPYKGCKYCKLPKSIIDELSKLDEITDSLRGLEQSNHKLISEAIKNCAEYRVEFYNKAIERLEYEQKNQR